MAVMKLESLVLVGVSVRLDGQADNLRLGTGYAADMQKPATCLTMRHPSPGPRQVVTPPAWAIEPARIDRRADGRVGGTGRSHWHAGVFAVRSFSSPLDASTPCGGSPEGGQRPTAAANPSSCQAPVATSVGNARLQASSPLTPSARLSGRFGGGQAPQQRAGRLAMASMRRD
jgi:hypothetical protein